MSKARQILGRVVTNLITPESYDIAHHIENIRNAGAKKVFQAIIKDEPIYKSTIPGRDTIWRRSFDLDTHASAVKRDREVLKPFTDKKGNVTHYELNPDSQAMHEVAVNAAQKTGIVTNKKLSEVQDTVERTDYHSIMGGYNLKTKNKDNKSTANYKDVWDFAVNKKEDYDSYFEAGRIKDVKETKVSKALDKLIDFNKSVAPKMSKKVNERIEGAKIILQPETNKKHVVNKARNILDKVISKQEISGELTVPAGVKPLSTKDKAKLVKQYKKAKVKEDDVKAINNAYALMYDDLLKKKIAKPREHASVPAKVELLNIKKSDGFSVVNPMKAIGDYRKAKWEAKRAKATLAPNDIVNKAEDIKNTAKYNVKKSIMQGTTGAGVVIGAPLLTNDDKR